MAVVKEEDLTMEEIMLMYDQEDGAEAESEEAKGDNCNE